MSDSIDNTVAIDNIVAISKSISDTDGISRKTAEIILPVFNHYTKQGLDFGSAYLAAMKLFNSELPSTLSNDPNS